nr:hypothetical protein [Borrelia miyamotoi]
MLNKQTPLIDIDLQGNTSS